MRLSIPFRMLAAGVAAGGLFAAAVAQPPSPPEGRDGPPPEHRDHLRGALDTNHDRELDADEIKNASAALATLDKNGDGRIDHDEFRPPMPPIPRGEGGFRGPPPGERGPEGRPPREGRSEAGPRSEDGPREGGPRERPFRGEGGPGPGGPSPERFVERAMTFDADSDGKLDRAELEKFAGEIAQRMRNAMAERGGEGPRRRPGGPGEGDRPERPRRPAD